MTLSRKDLELEKKHTDKLFKDENENFAVRHARAMLKIRGNVEEMTQWAVAYWRDEKTPKLKQKAEKAKKVYKNILGRYEAALAVIQPPPGNGEMGSFGGLAIEAPGLVNGASGPPPVSQPAD